MTVQERLKAAISFIRTKRPGMSQAQIAARAGYQATYLSDVINAKVPLSEKFATAFAARYGVNAQWLLTGEGEMIEEGMDVNDIKETPNDLVLSQQKTIENLSETVRRLSETIAVLTCKK